MVGFMSFAITKSQIIIIKTIFLPVLLDKANILSSRESEKFQLGSFIKWQQQKTAIKQEQ